MAEAAAKELKEPTLAETIRFARTKQKKDGVVNDAFLAIVPVYIGVLKRAVACLAKVGRFPRTTEAYNWFVIGDQYPLVGRFESLSAEQQERVLEITKEQMDKEGFFVHISELYTYAHPSGKPDNMGHHMRRISIGLPEDAENFKGSFAFSYQPR